MKTLARHHCGNLVRRLASLRRPCPSFHDLRNPRSVRRSALADRPSPLFLQPANAPPVIERVDGPPRRRSGGGPPSPPVSRCRLSRDQERCSRALRSVGGAGGWSIRRGHLIWLNLLLRSTIPEPGRGIHAPSRSAGRGRDGLRLGGSLDRQPPAAGRASPFRVNPARRCWSTTVERVETTSFTTRRERRLGAARTATPRAWNGRLPHASVPSHPPSSPSILRRKDRARAELVG